jgi:hypothetical protein
MRVALRLSILLSISLLSLAGTVSVEAQSADMSFFVTSAGPGKGADLGGLAGADQTCQTLAQAAGAGGKTWRAYLSTQGAGAVNARDRIGSGPWTNAKGVVIAKDVAELHAKNNLTKETALTESMATSTASHMCRTMTSVARRRRSMGQPAAAANTQATWPPASSNGTP